VGERSTHLVRMGKGVEWGRRKERNALAQPPPEEGASVGPEGRRTIDKRRAGHEPFVIHRARARRAHLDGRTRRSLPALVALSGSVHSLPPAHRRE
jgi:hypothetical protein